MEKRLMTLAAGVLLSTGVALAQSQVSGKVTSTEDGLPVIGASVKVVGTNTGTVTDMDGNFSLNAPAGAKLEITYIGMEPQTVKAGRNMTVHLVPDQHSLDEVMVVAYGTAKKSAFTGSAAVLKTDDIKKTANSNPVSALTGKVSGVQINSATGQPGQEGFNIRIRGISSINAGNSPLVILDGAPFDGDLNDLNPSDIASMTVLKDAASAALYGARGANGVILITTNNGRQGSSQITFDAKWGSNSRAIPDYKYVTSPAKYYEMWYGALRNYAYNYSTLPKNGGDATLYANRGNDSFARQWARTNLISNSTFGLGYNVYSVPEGQYLIGDNGKLNPNATLGNVISYNGNQYMLLPDDWTDAAYHNSLRQEYTLTASGNNQNGSFYGSANYLKNNGITYGSGYERFTGRLKADYQLRPWLKLSGNFSYAHSNSDYLSGDGDSGDSGNLFAVRTIAPIYPLYVRDGKGNIIINKQTGLPTYDYGDGDVIGIERALFTASNPLCDIQLNKSNVEGNTMNATGAAEIRFLKDFTFTSTNTAMVMDSRETSTAQPFFGQTADMGGYISKAHGRTWTYNYQQLLNWHRVFAHKHDAEVMLGHEYYHTHSYSLSGSKSNVYSVKSDELSEAIIDGSITSGRGEYNTEGWFGRAQYNYDNKYFGSFSYRRDASSRFDKSHRWGNFWSAGGAWIISKENWFQAPWVDILKIKASYGEQGNDAIGSYRYTNVFSIVNSDGQVGLSNSSTMGNKNITWEKNGNFNAGVEFSFWKGRLNGSVDYFYRRTSDMLAFFSIPISYGYSGYYDNVGNMRNSGVEIELNGDIIRTKDFQWSANLNFTAYKNKITSMPEANKRQTTPEGVRGYSSGNYFYGEGQSLYTFYMPKFAGVDPETGDALYYYDRKVDENGNKLDKPVRDVTTNGSEADQYLCGSALAWGYGGFGTSFAYKGFDLSVDFTYQLGGQCLDSGYSSAMSGSRGNAFHADLLKAWTPENRNTNVPRFEANYTYMATTSDRFLTSASYLSLQNVNIGYTLPSSIYRKLGVGKVRVYASGANLWLWSKRQGLDPRQSISGGTSNAYYSPIRTISGGLTVTF